MKKFLTVVGLAVFGLVQTASAALPMPTPDYSNAESVAGLALEVAVFIGLLAAAIAFFRRR